MSGGRRPWRISDMQHPVSNVQNFICGALLGKRASPPSASVEHRAFLSHDPQKNFFFSLESNSLLIDFVC